MRLFPFLFSILSLVSCELADPPSKEALKAFNEKYPNAEKVTWGLDRNLRQEASFTLDGTRYRADFEADGTWVETETNVKWDDLPDATKKAFKKEDKKKDIIEIELVDHHEKGLFYDIEYRASGYKQDIMITPDGRTLGTDRL